MGFLKDFLHSRELHVLDPLLQPQIALAHECEHRSPYHEWAEMVSETEDQKPERGCYLPVVAEDYPIRIGVALVIDAEDLEEIVYA